MKNLDPKEEAKLVKSTETAIRLSNSGMSPNDAIEKVAKDNSYTPPYIKLMVNAFNKSKAVHVFKTASQETRGSSFELANADVIINSIYAKTDAHQKVACELPKGNFSQIDFPRLQKVAAKEMEVKKETLQDRFYTDMSDTSKHTLINKYTALQKAAKDRLESDIRISYLSMNEALDEAAEHLKPMNGKSFQKVAQLVINSYPKYGQQVVKLLASRARHDIPELQKTAQAAIFPTKEPFLSISKMVEKAFETTRSKNALKAFEKSGADSLLQDFIANLGASKVHALGSSESKPMERILHTDYKKKDDDLIEGLDPSFYNQLKEVDTRRTFGDLSLYDDDLNKYEFPALIKAYNDSAQMTGTDNKVVLRNMMLHNLETGGIKDPFSLKTELDIGKVQQDQKKTPFEIAKLKAETTLLGKTLKPEKEIDFYEPKDKKSPLDSAMTFIQDKLKDVGKKEKPEKPSTNEEVLGEHAQSILDRWVKMKGVNVKGLSTADLYRASFLEAKNALLTNNPNVNVEPLNRQEKIDLKTFKHTLGVA